ncbi:amino acid/amide ABC transporter ATP-binding protein 2, HAAT family [Thalassovita litoralis]|uniref:Amino acid/amide ABC transporter ATP-binding protein 2, HAAT family n=1 Tax=Thalassovita litoralis TaxID=1010611 RepID=A0A521BLS9_9RHOB|nr:ABC transporter ATP-binding protein [Thalassovita litoralis]SMO48066.1 amino acid/amide ABC transporter ATP-binding protein 2, HAAT family [Thalassovita litoralis]
MTDTQNQLVLDKVNVFYGASHILFDMSFGVRKGRTLALLGRNGAGKTTTMKAIMGVTPVRSGSIHYGDDRLNGRQPHTVARHGIGLVPEDRQIFPQHTVDDNLRIAAKPGPDGQTDWTIDTIYDAFPILAGMRGRKAGMMSGGEQQLLSMARCLMGNPDLILLDEPSEGLAPIIVQEIGRLIRSLRSTGVTIILAEQNMHFCLGLSEDAVVIDKGQIVYVGTIQELRANQEITNRYLAI